MRTLRIPFIKQLIVRSMSSGAALALSACGVQPAFEAVYQAEQGSYETALVAARAAQTDGIDGRFLGSAESRCAAYAPILTILVAKQDFAGAADTCADYSQSCAEPADSELCFAYRGDTLQEAESNAELGARLSDEARTLMHFRWLMIRDDYEGRALTRPIY